MRRNRYSTRFAKRSVFFFFTFVALFGQAGHATDIVNYRSHVFLTGDYTLDSTPLSGGGAGPGMASGNFNITGVPCTLGVGPAASIVPCTTAGAVPAEIVSANVYWSTVYPANYNAAQERALGNGIFDGKSITGQPVGDTDPQKRLRVACWAFGGPTPVERVFVADVLRDLPFDTVNNVRRANGGHTVALPSVGNNGNGQLPFAQGATLVIAYRVVVAGKPDIMPLRAFVTYIGSSNMGQPGNSTAQQVLGGFYQLAPSAQARMTWVVGDASSKFKEFLTVNGLVPPGVNQTNPFGGAQGGGWNALTFNVGDNILSANSALNPNPNVIGHVQTQIVAGDAQSACLSFGVILFSGLVQNPDNDGILPVWKTQGMHFNFGGTAAPATFDTCLEYPFPNCVPLHLMGAAVGRRQIFIQLDWMHGNGDGTGGINGSGYHVHQPRLDSLKAIFTSFKAHNFDVFFAVGNNYQEDLGDAYKVLGKPFIIPAAYAQGGHDDDESTLACINQTDHPETCAYHQPYSVMSYKLGFAFVRDGNKLLKNPIVGHMPPNGSIHVMHYALMGHSLAGPFGVNGMPLSPDPRTTSGIGDRPGGGFMVTFGGWRSRIPDVDMVGDWKQQAGTIMHELGHNLNLQHAGWLKTPQCGGNYPSVMSYSIQTRLNTRADGTSVPDYSDGSLNPLNEGSLPTSQGSMGPLKYKVRFYSPLNPDTNTEDQKAKVHCDGSPITDGARALRSEGTIVGVPDWGNGTGITSFDTNFDGILGQTTYDSPDWNSLNLLQVSAQPNFGSISVGSVAYDAGSVAYDAGSVAYDAGSVAYDAGSVAYDAGSVATDAGSIVTDAGSVVTDVGSIAFDAGDEDQNTHNASSVDPPQSPTDCAGCGTKAQNELSDNLVTLTPPASGLVETYNIYRCRVKTELGENSCTPVKPFFSSIPGGSPTPSFTDTVNDFVHAGATCPIDKTCFNTKYVYSATDVVLVIDPLTGQPDHSESRQSNTTDPTEVTHLFVIADSTTVTYNGTIQYGTFKIYGDVSGSLNPGDVTCTGSRNVVTNLPVVCSGPLTTSPTNGVTYNAPYLSYTPGTLTINRAPLTITALTNTKIYDGTTSAAATPTVSGLQGNDTVTGLVETYDTADPGTGKTLTVTAYTVNDGNGGGNYTVNTVTNTTGVINVETWSTAASMMTPRSFHTATLLNDGRVLIAGGLDGSGKSLASAEVYTYNSGGGSWTVVGNMPNKADHHKATLLPSGKVFISGGGNASTQVFDPVTNTFTATGGMSSQRSNHIAVYLSSIGKVLIAGGSANSGAVTNSAQLWDPTTGTFSNTGNMTVARELATATLLPDGKVLITGGRSGSNGPYLSSAETYNPATGTFSATGSMPGPRFAHESALLPDGTVLVFGGSNGTTDLGTALIYSAGAFTSTGANASNSLATARRFFTATLLSGSGRVLAAGGLSGASTRLKSAELYTNATKSFLATGSLSVARSSHTATLLGNGKVLVTGGVGSGGSSISSSELFNPVVP